MMCNFLFHFVRAIPLNKTRKWEKNNRLWFVIVYLPTVDICNKTDNLRRLLFQYPSIRLRDWKYSGCVDEIRVWKKRGTRPVGLTALRCYLRTFFFFASIKRRFFMRHRLSGRPFFVSSGMLKIHYARILFRLANSLHFSCYVETTWTLPKPMQIFKQKLNRREQKQT